MTRQNSYAESMATDEKLTILLTLKGRHLHTLRWMWHANRIHLPYHIVIADGEVHPTIDRLLSDRSVFPNLSYEYHRYREATYADFYKKLAESIEKVKTEYVMWSDNDDFPMVTGIQRSIEFLKNNPEYVCAGGKIPNFSIQSRKEIEAGVIGHMVRLEFGYKNQNRGVDFSSMSNRVMDQILQYQPVSYHIFQTRVPKVIYSEFEALQFSDLSIAEFYHALRTVTFGKAHTDPAIICYLRQAGTSTNAMVTNDWVHYLLRGTLPQDFRALATAISDKVAQLEGYNATELREDILNAYANYLRIMLGATTMRYRFPRLFRLKKSLMWLKEWRIMPNWYLRRIMGANLSTALKSSLLTGTSFDACKCELGQIEATLQGDEFLAFLELKAPDLVRIPAAN